MKFRMVDRILSWEPHRLIRGVKAVSFEEYELRRPLGDEPCLPESLVMESLFQLGNWLVVLSTGFTRMGLVVRLDEVAFPARLRPGSQLRMEVEVRCWREDGILFDGCATSGQQTIAMGRGCLAVPVVLDEYQSAHDVKVLFSEIHRPESSKEDAAWRD